MTENNSSENLGYRIDSYEDYRNHQAISNSDLKHLHSPKLFHFYKTQPYEEEEKTPQHYKMGDMIDLFLLDYPKFKESYLFQPEFTSTPSSPNQNKFCDLIIAQTDQGQTLSKEDIGNIYSQCYKVTKKAMESGKHFDLGIELYNDLRAYIEFTKEAAVYKGTYDEAENEILNKIVESGSADSEFHKLIINPPFEKTAVFTHLRIINIEWLGITWKCEVDRLIVDFKEKVIYNIDLKSTSSHLINFPYDYIKYHYPRQQFLYKQLILKWLVNNKIISANEIDQWVVYTRVAVVQTTGLYEVAIIPIPTKVLELGEKELIKAAEDIKYYDKHGWDIPRNARENNYLYVVDWDEYTDKL